MGKQSFAKFWVIVIAAFLLVGLIVMAWFITLEATEKESLEKYNQQQLLLVDGAAVGIEGLFTDLTTNISSLAELPEIQYFEEDAYRSELTRKLEEMAPQGITDIGLLDANGIAQAYVVDTGSEGIDFSWRSYFKTAQAIEPGNILPVIVEIQTISPGELGFKIAIPIFETMVDANHPSPSGDFSGVIVGSLTFDTLVQRYVLPFKPPGNGHIFLVNKDYDIIWASDNDMMRINLLVSGQGAFTQMANRMAAWGDGTSAGDFYTFERASGWNRFDLIAFAPVNIGDEWLAIGVRTPEEVARQTSLSNYQGQQLIFIISVITIFLGIVIGRLVLGREVRRRFQIEEALKKSEMEQIIVKERNRLAGDLHDSVTQSLYGILLHTDAARGQLAAGKTDQATTYLDDIKTAGKEALAEMRLLIFELRPPVLEREGLGAALETRLHTVERRAGLKTDFQSRLEERLPLEIEDGLYRIAQEALNNILKHAQAQHIQLNLYCDRQAIKLEIIDDGRGCDLTSAKESGGMGLSNMHERATQLGGELTIQSAPGEGTHITVEVKV